MAVVIHDPIPEQYGGAFASAFAGQLERAANAVEWHATIGPDAKRALITQLAQRWLGCALTAFVADGGAPTSTFAWQTFLVKYPVCMRLFAESEHAWRRDCEQLEAAVVQAFPSAIVANVEHRAGFLGSRRSAHVLTFVDGRRAVYRPYALPAAAWFMDVCAALNAELELPLHVRAIRVDGEHTWDDFVESAPCEDVRAYFVRAGMVTRLFEAVRAVDMHVRNVRLIGAHPVILDLEGILAWRGAPSPAAAGFLPVATRGPRGERVDLGGLNPGGSLTLPVRQPVLRGGAFVDEAPVKDIAPTVPAAIREHVEEIIEGYRALDAALGRASLDALVARAATFKTSVFGRSGMAYRALLFASIAPDLLRSEQLREAFLLANAEDYELSSLRSLRDVRYIGTAPVPTLRPHSAEALAAGEAIVRATIAAEPPITS
jgi:hypothetical protein